MKQFKNKRLPQIQELNRQRIFTRKLPWYNIPSGKTTAFNSNNYPIRAVNQSVQLDFLLPIEQCRLDQLTTPNTHLDSDRFWTSDGRYSPRDCIKVSNNTKLSPQAKQKLRFDRELRISQELSKQVRNQSQNREKQYVMQGFSDEQYEDTTSDEIRMLSPFGIRMPTRQRPQTLDLQEERSLTKQIRVRPITNTKIGLYKSFVKTCKANEEKARQSIDQVNISELSKYIDISNIEVSPRFRQSFFGSTFAESPRQTPQMKNQDNPIPRLCETLQLNNYQTFVNKTKKANQDRKIQQQLLEQKKQGQISQTFYVNQFTGDIKPSKYVKIRKIKTKKVEPQSEVYVPPIVQNQKVDKTYYDLESRAKASCLKIQTKTLLKVDTNLDAETQGDLNYIYGWPLPDVLTSPAPKSLKDDY